MIILIILSIVVVIGTGIIIVYFCNKELKKAIFIVVTITAVIACILSFVINFHIAERQETVIRSNLMVSNFNFITSDDIILANFSFDGIRIENFKNIHFTDANNSKYVINPNDNNCVIELTKGKILDFIVNKNTQVDLIAKNADLGLNVDLYNKKT